MAFLLIGNLCCISSFVLIMLESDQLYITVGFIITLFLFIIAGCFSFIYSFTPIFTTIKDKATNNKNKIFRKKQLNPANAAIGIYYMSLLGVIVISALGCYITIHVLGGPSGRAWKIGACIDVILRYAVIMTVGLPPPKSLIHFIKMKIFGMAAINVSIRERGVVSSGIVEVERGYGVNSFGSVANGGGGGGSGGNFGGISVGWHMINDTDNIKKPVELIITDHMSK